MRYDEAISAPHTIEPLTKLLWIDALRSGKYKQCRYVFTVGYGEGSQFCALGLLSEIAGYRAVKALSDSNWAIIIGLNDHGYTFPEIADYVEEKL